MTKLQEIEPQKIKRDFYEHTKMLAENSASLGFSHFGSFLFGSAINDRIDDKMSQNTFVSIDTYSRAISALMLDFAKVEKDEHFPNFNRVVIQNLSPDQSKSLDEQAAATKEFIMSSAKRLRGIKGYPV